MQIRTTWLAAVLALLSPLSLSAQEQVEDRRSSRQIADSAEIATLARELTKDVRGDSARAAVLYEWVARNVHYDAAEFFRGGDGHEKAEDVYRHRSALCGGFVGLYRRMAGEVGLRTMAIAGYAKGVDYRYGRSTKKPNHAWLALHLAGGWRLVDPTWGAGVIVGRKFEPRFTWEFFLIPAEQLILSHYPEEVEWQLLDRPLQRSEFERMRAVPRTLFAVGFSPEAIRATALTPGVQDFPLVGPQGAHVRVLQAPIAGTLAAATPVRVEIEWPGASEMALVTDGRWTKLQQSGPRFTGEVLAAGTSVTLVGRTGATAPYATLLHYNVRTGDGAPASTK